MNPLKEIQIFFPCGSCELSHCPESSRFESASTFSIRFLPGTAMTSSRRVRWTTMPASRVESRQSLQFYLFMYNSVCVSLWEWNTKIWTKVNYTRTFATQRNATQLLFKQNYLFTCVKHRFALRLPLVFPIRFRHTIASDTCNAVEWSIDTSPCVWLFCWKLNQSHEFFYHGFDDSWCGRTESNRIESNQIESNARYTVRSHNSFRVRDRVRSHDTATRWFVAWSIQYRNARMK